jgi:hypothetical protein
MLQNIISQYLQLKQNLKLLTKELREELEKDNEYSIFNDDCKASNEVKRACRERLIETSPSIGSLNNKVLKAKGECKLLKEAIEQACKVVDSETGEQLSLDFKF